MKKTRTKYDSTDRDERVSLMEPLVLSTESRHRPALTELAFELATKSAGFSRSMPSGVFVALADLVRAMNCYYSNLIEGHDTHPVDIERALKRDYSSDKQKRNLQLEAQAHIAVQQWIDSGGLRGRALTKAGILETHHRFCEMLPEDLLWVSDQNSGQRQKVLPGKLRQHDVQVGGHIAVSPGAIPRFLERFEEVYSALGQAESVLAAAAAHHRLLWIHPFLDGNGRVARLISHAVFLDALETGSVWSIARGLARNETAYKQHLIACDEQRRNDWDERGNLSEDALANFTQFFLQICLDQVSFMDSLVQPKRLRTRILLWAEEEARLGLLPSHAGRLLEAILYRGEIPRSDIAEVVGSSARHARRAVSALLDKGVLVSDSDRSPVRLAFPAALAPRWMPGLFPEQ